MFKNSEVPDSTSLFHSELIKFLLESCQKQILDEGIDPKTDPHVQILLQDLTSSFPKGQIPLTQIVENYQQLLASKGSLHMEKTLQQLKQHQIYYLHQLSDH